MAFLAEWLEIDGFSLSTPGWTHTDLSGLLDRPDVRTASRIIPGGDGVVAYRIRRTTSRRTLPMVIFGDVDGDGVAYSDQRAGVEANIEKISAAIVDPPATADGTRTAVLHLRSGQRTAKVRVVAPLKLGALGPAGYLATLDLEFPYGMFPVVLPAAPTIGTATAQKGGGTVTWTAPANTEGVDGYEVKAYRASDNVQVASNIAAASATSYRAYGLVAGTAVYFKVAARTVMGAGTQSAASASVTPLATTAPGAPTIGTATAGDTQATASWTAPTDDGGSARTSYILRAYRASDNVLVATLSGIAATATSATITGLTNGTAVYLKVAAVNAVDTGTESAASNTVTPKLPGTTPGAPTVTSFSADTTTAHRVSVGWSAPTSDGGQPITDYRVRVYRSSDSSLLVSSTVAASARNATITDPALIGGVVVFARVAAVNVHGEGTASPNSTGATPVGPPQAPTIGTATAGHQKATVAFTPPTNNGGSAITSYEVLASSGATATGTASPITVTGLTNGTSYTFQVRAVNAHGASAWSAASNAVTPAQTAPAAPTGVDAADYQDQQSVVTWTAPTDDGGSAITGYRVTRTNPDATTTVVTVGNVLTVTLTGLTNGQTYSVRVAAINAIGTGPDSSATIATPSTVPGAPTVGTITAGAGSVTVPYTDNPDNGGAEVTQHRFRVKNASTNTVVLTSTTSAASPVTLSGLTPGTAVYVTVASLNGSGESAQSANSNTVTPT